MPDNLISETDVTYHGRVVGAQAMAFLRARGMSISTFATQMNWSYKRAEDLCEGERGTVTWPECIEIARVVGTDPQVLTSKEPLIPDFFTDGDRETGQRLLGVLTGLGAGHDLASAAEWLASQVPGFRDGKALKVLKGSPNTWVSLPLFDRLMKALVGLAERKGFIAPTEADVVGPGWPAVATSVRGDDVVTRDTASQPRVNGAVLTISESSETEEVDDEAEPLPTLGPSIDVKLVLDPIDVVLEPRPLPRPRPLRENARRMKRQGLPAYNAGTVREVVAKNVLTLITTSGKPKNWHFVRLKPNTGKSPGYFHQMMKCESELTELLLRAVAAYFGKTLEWLVTDHGGPAPEPPAPPPAPADNATPTLSRGRRAPSRGKAEARREATYIRARAVVILKQRCSFDFLKTELGCSLTTCAPLITRLEREGVVGPIGSAKHHGRKVLVQEAMSAPVPEELEHPSVSTRAREIFVEHPELHRSLATFRRVAATLSPKDCYELFKTFAIWLG